MHFCDVAFTTRYIYPNTYHFYYCSSHNNNYSTEEVCVFIMQFISLLWLSNKFHQFMFTIAGIISLLAGMAAQLHLKVVRRNAESSSGDENLLFSDVPLGQTKARTLYIDTHTGFQSLCLSGFYLHLQVLTDKSPVCDLFFGSELYHKVMNVTSSSTPQDVWSNSRPATNTAAAAASYLALIIFWQVQGCCLL